MSSVTSTRLGGAGRKVRQLQLDARAPAGGAAKGAPAGDGRPSYKGPPSVGLGDGTHDRQAQARAPGGAGAGSVGAVEALEHALALGGRDTGAIVADEEAQAIGALALHIQA